MVYQVAEKTGGNRSSMLQDFDTKRQSEIDFINGAIVREAEALGLDVPVNRAVTRLVQVLDSVHAEQLQHTGD
jgi:2-dehydropantoate 2-reductase